MGKVGETKTRGKVYKMAKVSVHRNNRQVVECPSFAGQVLNVRRRITASNLSLFPMIIPVCL